MSLAILSHFLCAQHVSDINISIIRSLRLFCWITTLVILFLVHCVLEFRCGCASACNTDTTPTQPHWNSNTHRTKNNTTNVVIQQNSRKLLMMDILMSETCWAHKKWDKIASDIKLVFYSPTITMMHGPINISLTFTCFASVQDYDLFYVYSWLTQGTLCCDVMNCEMWKMKESDTGFSENIITRRGTHFSWNLRDDTGVM